MTGGARLDGGLGAGREGSLGGMAGDPLVLGFEMLGSLFVPDRLVAAFFKRSFQLIIGPGCRI